MRTSTSLQSLYISGESALPLHVIRGVPGAIANPRDDTSSVAAGSTRGTEKNFSSSRTLDLSSQGLDPLAGILIGALIPDNTSLTELSLTNNTTLGPEGARAVIDKVGSSQLKVLDLNAVIHGAAAGTPKAKKQIAQLERLGRSLGRLSSLEKLTLDKNSLVELNSIGQLHELKFLTLNNNRIEALPEETCFLRSLKRLAVRYNRLLELPAAIGQLESLESLDLKANRLTYLPASIGQLCYLKHLDLSENSLSQLDPCICDCSRLDRLEVKQNPLTRPPIALAKQGMQPIRRYFHELSRSGEATSQAARLVLLGHGESGKTSLQRGLRYGAPRPAEKDERTVQLDISALVLGEGASQVLVSMWDLGGQLHYASLLQPYLVSGSLYLLLVPALEVNELDARHDELLGRWLDYLHIGAPESVVQLVLTHCDYRLRRDKDWTVAYLEERCSAQRAWMQAAAARHQERQPRSSKPLRIQPSVLCVCAVAGGDLSLRHLKSRLESLVLTKPPLLPSVGQSIPRTWLLAISFLRAIRDGRSPVKAVQSTLAAQEARISLTLPCP